MSYGRGCIVQRMCVGHENVHVHVHTLNRKNTCQKSPTCFRKILFHLQCLQIDRLCAYTCTCTTDILAGFISVWEGGGGFCQGFISVWEGGGPLPGLTRPP